MPHKKHISSLQLICKNYVIGNGKQICKYVETSYKGGLRLYHLNIPASLKNEMMELVLSRGAPSPAHMRMFLDPKTTSINLTDINIYTRGVACATLLQLGPALSKLKLPLKYGKPEDHKLLKLLCCPSLTEVTISLLNHKVESEALHIISHNLVHLKVLSLDESGRQSEHITWLVPNTQQRRCGCPKLQVLNYHGLCSSEAIQMLLKELKELQSFENTRADDCIAEMARDGYAMESFNLKLLRILKQESYEWFEAHPEFCAKITHLRVWRYNVTLPPKPAQFSNVTQITGTVETLEQTSMLIKYLHVCGHQLRVISLAGLWQTVGLCLFVRHCKSVRHLSLQYRDVQFIQAYQDIPELLHDPDNKLQPLENLQIFHLNHIKELDMHRSCLDGVFLSNRLKELYFYRTAHPVCDILFEVIQHKQASTQLEKLHLEKCWDIHIEHVTKLILCENVSLREIFVKKCTPITKSEFETLQNDIEMLNIDINIQAKLLAS